MQYPRPVDVEVQEVRPGDSILTLPALEALTSCCPGSTEASGNNRLQLRDGVPAAVLATILVPHWEATCQEASLLLLKRSRSLRKHPGQIGFPGGRKEDSDATLLCAAYREAAEEVGLQPERARVIGPLTPGETPSGFVLHPFLAITDQQHFVAQEEEVEEIYRIPVPELLRCPVRYKRADWQGQEYSVVYFDLDEICVWGVTGYILEEVLRTYFCWCPPDDALL